MDGRAMRFASSSTMMVVCYCSLLFLFSPSLPCLAAGSISSSEPLFPNQTLISPSQIFELGFFTPNGSSNQYVGIWYKKFTPSKVVWVANRDRPLVHKDRLASLTIGSGGNLRLLDRGRNPVWSTNVSSRLTGSVAMLQDTGNLVLTDADSGDVVWQSFDFPTDVLLPGMKIGINVKTGEKRSLISWRADTDPSPGNFSMEMTSEIPPQPFIWNGSTPYWRGGQWDKSKFIGIFDMERSYLSGYNVQQDIQQGTTYYTFSTNGNSSFMYLFILPEGSFVIMTWVDKEREWRATREAPQDRCETYGTCGPFGYCNSSAPSTCECLDRFGPESEEEWERGNWTRGCRRLTELRCERGLSTGAPSSGSGAGEADWFLKLNRMKLPDTAIYLPLSDQNAGDCLTWCLNNCSCIAYSYVDSIGCMTWSDKLMDIQRFNMSGKDLFLRLAYDERGGVEMNCNFHTNVSSSYYNVVYVSICIIEKGTDSDQNSIGTRRKLIISLTTIAGGSIIMAAGMYVLCSARDNKTADTPSSKLLQRIRDEEKDDLSVELPIFDLKSILAATDNFSIRNKLGQGGFGPVYKGTLQDGKEVAVKRLSSSSGQGMEEFKNEIVLISKLQHRNLVKLMGCCIVGEEKILVYEYLPNKSLDTFLFDSSRSRELTWEKRFDIIQGVARGLLYLHRDSCLRVIHRDLKASNILLDEKMNPKISDFGLARIFQATQDVVNTRRVVGTLGYMAPEYAMGGMFSEKSDAYSFGVMILEIISSKRNSSLCYIGETLNLLSYAWQLWREGRGMEIIHEANSADYFASLQEVSKCIQIGLLCIQDQPVDRPNMSSVVLMLSGKLDLPDPKPPSLTSFQSSSGHQTQPQQEKTLSINAMTHTQVEGR